MILYHESHQISHLPSRNGQENTSAEHFDNIPPSPGKAKRAAFSRAVDCEFSAENIFPRDSCFPGDGNKNGRLRLHHPTVPGDWWRVSIAGVGSITPAAHLVITRDYIVFFLGGGGGGTDEGAHGGRRLSSPPQVSPTRCPITALRSHSHRWSPSEITAELGLNPNDRKNWGPSAGGFKASAGSSAMVSSPGKASSFRARTAGGLMAPWSAGGELAHRHRRRQWGDK